MIRHTDKNIIKLQKALEFMRENDNYTISEVANYCDMSTRRFNAVFKEALNVTPRSNEGEISVNKGRIAA